MKQKLIGALVIGALASNLAFAVTAASGATATYEKSSNLEAEWYDSGLFSTNSYSNWRQTNTQSATTSTLLRTFQDAGQWYAERQFVTTQSFDQTWDVYTGQAQSLNLNLFGNGGRSQWAELSLTTDTAFTYSAHFYGTNGEKTSPRGLAQTISPGFAVSENGLQSNVQSQTTSWNNGGYGYRYGTLNAGDSFQMLAEATDDGTVTQLNLYLETAKIFKETLTQNYSYESARWTAVEAIQAPVPEPETYAMFLAGLGIIGAVARRRQQA